MGNSEFVRVSSAEKVFGDKHLLQSELELLNLVQSFTKYKQLRLDELTLKVGLKMKLEQMKATVEKLEKLLPVAGYREEKKTAEMSPEKKKEHLSMQEEIERIRRKIERLERQEF